MHALPALATFAALTAFCASGAAPADAAPPPAAPRSTHGAWSVACDTPAGASSPQCALIQNVVAEDRPDVGLSVMFLKPAGGERDTAILRVLAPSSVFLPKGVQVYVDGTLEGVLYFARCLPAEGCYGQVLIEKSVLNTWRKMPAVVFVVYQTPETNIGFPIDMHGLGDGLDALPSTSASFEEYAKKSIGGSVLAP